MFSYWRTTEPERTTTVSREALLALADEAAAAASSSASRTSTRATSAPGDEAARFLLARLDHPALQLVWDPANASILGETAVSQGL